MMTAGRPSLVRPTDRRIAGAVCLVVLLGLLEGCLGPGKGADRPGEGGGTVLPVEVMSVEYADGYVTEERYIGRVVSRGDSDLGFERAGRIREIRVREGDAVASGQTLAVLDTDLLRGHRRTLEAQLERGLADLEQARAKRDLARATLTRRSDLAKAESISRQMLDDAVFEEKAADAAMGSADARLSEVRREIENVDVQIRQSTLIAPFAGSVVARPAFEGTAVAAGETVLRTITTGSPRFRVGLPPDVARAIDAEATHEVRIGSRTHRAGLLTRGRELDIESNAVPVLFDLLEAPDVWVGEIARLSLPLRVESRGFWIPITGLVEGRQGSWGVLGVEADAHQDGLYRTVRREMSVIHFTATDAFVSGSVVDGDRIVTTGLHRLVPGQLVRLP